eukprot:113440_1
MKVSLKIFCFIIAAVIVGYIVLFLTSFYLPNAHIPTNEPVQSMKIPIRIKQYTNTTSNKQHIQTNMRKPFNIHQSIYPLTQNTHGISFISNRSLDIFKTNFPPFLISFPASGNTYTRLLLEYTTLY